MIDNLFISFAFHNLKMKQYLNGGIILCGFITKKI